MQALLIVALAAYRLTRLVTTDTLTETPRLAVIRWAVNRRHAGKLAFKVDDLVECPFCAGWWVTLLVLVLAHFRASRTIVAAFAAAGLQSLASNVDVTAAAARDAAKAYTKRAA